MALTDHLADILNTQKKAVSDLEEEIHALANSDLTKENAMLKEELDTLKNEYEKTRLALNEAKDENAGLKNALYEQIYNEKLSILNLSAKKLDIYFNCNQETAMNRLNQFESKVRARIDNMFMQLEYSHISLSDDIYKRLDALSQTLNDKIAFARMEYAKTNGAFSENEKAELDSLKKEQISDEQIRKVAKKNNIEAFIGQNLINKIGILLIIIGVIAAAQFTYFQIPDMLKGIMMFTFGGVMLVAGELLNRKKANVFSLGVTAGGVAVLYVALSISYFALEILSMVPAIVVCILITAVSFLLSIRYHSKTITAFALIGGYLPIFSISGSLQMIYGAMVYFMVLNLLALSISFRKKWIICSFIGLFLNIAGTIYIMNCTIAKLYDKPFGMSHILLLGYIVIAFLVYTAIPIISTFKTSKHFNKSDVVLLGINTFMSALILYGAFYEFHLDEFTGLLAILFAITYLALGRMIHTKFKNEKLTTALFYLTGFAFVVLIIPFQFGKAWLSLGWLAEGVALTTYGILKNEKSFRRSGFVIDILCAASFIFVDVIGQIGYLFAYKYLAITLGSIIILSAFIYKNEQFGRFQKIYKYITIINFWIYTIYISTKAGELIENALFDTLNFSIYLVNTMILAATVLIAYALLRMKRIADLGTKIIAVILYGIAALVILYCNFNRVFVYTGNGEMPTIVTVLGTIVLIFANLVAVFAMKDLMRYLVMEQKVKIEWYPLVVSAFFVLLVTQNLITQYQLQFSNMAISIIYAITALLWIVFGFIKKYTFIRRFGLGLAILSVVKLFIVDLSYLTEGYKIVAYFALGASLIAISFVYQTFSKKLELKEGVAMDE